MLPSTQEFRAFLAALSAAWLTLFCVSCDGADRAADLNDDTQNVLARVVVGRAVDVYGFESEDSRALTLFQRDVLVGPDIVDERGPKDRKSDEETRFDFVGVDASTLRPRLLIPRPVRSSAFTALFRTLDERALVLDDRSYGDDDSTPFRAVPRNAAIRLDFESDLKLPEDFFVARDENGRVTGIKNPEAIQLLEIVGDPRDASNTGDFRMIPARIVQRARSILLDPVVLADEAREFGLSPNASGLPRSADSRSANMRIALALEGPLRMPGLRPRGQNVGLVGLNLSARNSVIRDFRSGNADDDNFWVSNGFVRDDTPPRLLGEMPLRLARVDIRGARDQRILLYKAGIEHEIDVGDALRVVEPSSGAVLARDEVIEDPIDDQGDAGVQFVTVRVRDASAFERLDPSKRADFPRDPDKLEEWLSANAPLCVLRSEFDASKDQALNFINFTPKPRPSPGRANVPLNRNISPFAWIVLRFTKPIDMATVRPLDSLIFATSGDTRVVLDAKRGTPHLLLGEIFDEDGSQTRIRSVPPQGFYLDDEMRKPENVDRFPYYIHLIGGFQGIRDLGGRPLDLQLDQADADTISIPFYLDTTVGGDGARRYPNNRVINIARRFLDRDEDEDQDNLEDAFGAIVYLNGRIQGRPTSRQSAFVDDRNQLPSPPTPPLSYCDTRQSALLTGSSPVGIPIQTPLNPLGSRTQMMWREIDLSLSRTNPFDFNLDVEAMWWAPFQSTQNAGRTEFDIYDDITLYIGHSERRPNNCTTIPGSQPAYRASGLRGLFFHNFLRDVRETTASFTENQQRSAVSDRPEPGLAFARKPLTITESQAVFEPNGINRFLPLPEFDNKRYVWRDERLTQTGGGDGLPRILSPFLTTFGNAWDGRRWSPTEDGRVGALALPLLVEFFVEPDDPELPRDNPWATTGLNGWQVSLTVASNRLPGFRAYTSGQ